MYRYAGNGNTESYGSDGNALDAGLALPVSVWQATSGVVYVVEQEANCVRHIDTSGIIAAFAGVCGALDNFMGDGGAATASLMQNPSVVIGSPSGSIFIVDYSNCVIREVSGGIITRFAGTGAIASTGNEEAATSASFQYPYGLWLDTGGTFYVVELDYHRVRSIDSSLIVHAFAGKLHSYCRCNT